MLTFENASGRQVTLTSCWMGAPHYSPRVVWLRDSGSDEECCFFGSTARRQAKDRMRDILGTTWEVVPAATLRARLRHEGGALRPYLRPDPNE